MRIIFYSVNAFTRSVQLSKVLYNSSFASVFHSCNGDMGSKLGQVDSKRFLAYLVFLTLPHVPFSHKMASLPSKNLQNDI